MSLKAAAAVIVMAVSLSGCEIATSTPALAPAALEAAPTTNQHGPYVARDFTYVTNPDGTSTITGFAHNANPHPQRVLAFPDRDPAGRIITAIGDNAFCVSSCRLPTDGETIRAHDGNNIRSISVWPAHLTRIGVGAFAGNVLTAIPPTWQQVRTIDDYAFDLARLTALPATWGQVTHIGNWALSADDLSRIPDSWGHITRINAWTFASNHITRIPHSWGSVRFIGAGAFAYDKITKLPEQWGAIASIGNSAFYSNALTTLPHPHNRTVGQAAFSHNCLAGRIPAGLRIDAVDDQQTYPCPGPARVARKQLRS